MMSKVLIVGTDRIGEYTWWVNDPANEICRAPTSSPPATDRHEGFLPVGLTDGAISHRDRSSLSKREDWEP
jgi:hypothetical protein